jgi:hypothetical protein
MGHPSIGYWQTKLAATRVPWNCGSELKLRAAIETNWPAVNACLADEVHDAGLPSALVVTTQERPEAPVLFPLIWDAVPTATTNVPVAGAPVA